MKSNHTGIQLPKPEIFSFEECLNFLDRGYDDCLYAIEGNRVIKPLLIDGEQMLFVVSDGTNALKVEIILGYSSQEILNKAGSYMADWFDLQRDLHPFYQRLDNHSQLSWMSGRFYGLRLMGIPDLFEALCWCVIGQQINVTFAHRLKRQLVERYGTFLNHDSKRHYFFPIPEALASLNTGDLKELQFSRQKAEYIIGTARAFAEGNLSKQVLDDCDDTGQMLDRLKEIRGVGPWTANYALMKSLKRPNCITYGDTGLQSAVSSLLGLDRKPTRKEINTFFEPFAGWESYLNIYLWRILSASN